MAELLGTISAAAGLATNILELTKAIRRLIKDMEEAPSTLQRVSEELQILECILQAASSQDNDRTGRQLQDDELLREALESCFQSVKEIKTRLEPFLEARKADGKTSQKKFSWTAFRMQQQVKELEPILERLERKKLSICILFQLRISIGMHRGPAVVHERKITDIHEPGKRLERRSTFQEKYYKTLDPDPGAEERLAEFKKLISQSIDDTLMDIIKTLPGESQAEGGGSFHVLKQIDKMIAQELWKLDTPPLRRIKEYVLSRKHEDVMGKLFTVDYGNVYAQVPDANPETCKWIYDEPVFEHFEREPASQILHVSGKPGQGKSVLAKTIFQRFCDLQATETPRTKKTLYYFCNNRINSHETSSSILGAMIHQLLTERPSLIETFVKYSDNNNDTHPFATVVPKNTWTLDALWKTFFAMITASHFKEIFVVIDGLDEADSNSIVSLLSNFVKDLDKLDENDAVKLKLFLTSRPEEYILIELEDHPHLRIDPVVTQADISVVVKKRMEERNIQRQLKKLRLGKQETVEFLEELVTRSEGMFLWVTLALDTFEKARGFTLNRLKNLVKGLPLGLNELYSSILQRLAQQNEHPDDMRLAKNIFTWIVIAARPLTLAELRIALAVEPGSSALVEDDIIPCIADVQALCGSFVGIVSSERNAFISEESEVPLEEDFSATVRLIHQSAKDYLLGTAGTLAETHSTFRVSPEKGHSEIAIRCITYLMFEEFSNEVTHTEEKILQRLEKHPFLAYAALFWPFHVQRSSKGDNDKEVVLQLACKFITEHSSNFQCAVALMDFLTTPSRPYRRRSGLHFAATQGLYDVVKKIIDNPNIDINAIDGLEENVLFGITRSIRESLGLPEILKIVQLLLENGVKLNKCSCHGISPLHVAIASSAPLELCELLIRYGVVDPVYDVEDATGRRSIHVAALEKREDILKLLIEMPDSDIDVKDRAGFTPLALACWSQNLEAVEMLVRKGANVNLCPLYPNERTPLQLAIQQGEDRNLAKIVQILLESNADPNISTPGTYNTALQLAAAQEIPEVIQLLLDYGAEIDAATDDAGLTALHIAVCGTCVECVKILIDCGADIEAYSKPPIQSTPIHHAIKIDIYDTGADIVRTLLDGGANPNIHSGDLGQSALSAAIFYDRESVTRLLLERSIDVEFRDQSGATPLMTASSFGSVADLLMLLPAGAAIDARDNDGDSALLLAVKLCNIEHIKVLLEHGADINLQNTGGETSLMCAAKEGNLTLLRLLLSFEATVDKELLGEHALIVSVASEDLVTFQEYVNDDQAISSDVNMRQYLCILSATGIIRIDSKQCRAMYDQVLYHVTRQNPPTSNRKSTMLHWATLVRDIELIGQLLKHGASTQSANGDGWLPWHIAVRMELPPEVCNRLWLDSDPPAPPHNEMPHHWVKADPLRQDGALLLDEGLRIQIPEKYSANVDNPFAVRANSCIPFNCDEFYYYEVAPLTLVTSSYNTLIDLGFSLELARSDRHLGFDQYGWSYTVGHRFLRYDSTWCQASTVIRGKSHYGPGDIIGCGLDIKNGRLFFTENGKLLGEPGFLPGLSGPLYPHLTCGTPGAEVSVNFGQHPFEFELVPEELLRLGESDDDDTVDGSSVASSLGELS